MVEDRTMVKETQVRAVIRLRFREQGESGMSYLPFSEGDARRLIGRAMTRKTTTVKRPPPARPPARRRSNGRA
jgi:hypothetical protein